MMDNIPITAEDIEALMKQTRIDTN
jgi:hypothetical protein